jgi:site-specific DNA-methyltransferase (cytosine-N4-specific)
LAHYDDGQVTFLLGDVRDVLREMPAESVNMCVTSPPYWGLRDYGTATWKGGDVACEHKQTVARHNGGRVAIDGFNGSARPNSDKGAMNYRDTCGKCGARRIDQQLGLERTPEEYVAKMVDVFREVRRVLRDDGTLWLNLGDSYAGGGGYSPNSPSNLAGSLSSVAAVSRVAGATKNAPFCKPKDLVGIPWMLAFALRADGWYLRSDIIWAKPNPMPESVTDRPTKAHEMLFLLSKSPRYYYNADAIREGVSEASVVAGANGKGESLVLGQDLGLEYADRWDAMTKEEQADAGRNKRSVWTIATAPYAEAHFATFPPALVEPCILAGCPEGGIVLDPFIGSGTTALVARRLGRKAIGIDLNAGYLDMAVRRAGGQLAMEMTR